METKKCPKCGTAIAQNEQFCQNCGYDLHAAELKKSRKTEYETLPRVSFGQAIKLGFKNTFKFKGRARRSEFWWFSLFTSIPIFIGYIMALVFLNEYFAYAALIFMYFVLVPNLSLTFRRLHDADYSGWLILIGLIPFVGVFFLIAFYCADSSTEESVARKYGESPKYKAINN